MDSEALVQLALEMLSCSQKELALRLEVSPTQISKWKKGEHMSREMEEKIRALANIGDKDPSFVLWAGSLEDAAKWEKLIHFLAESAAEGEETGYDCYPLEDEEGLLCWRIFHTLRQMGVDLPKTFPKDLDVGYDNVSDDNDTEEIWSLIEKNPHSSLIYKIFRSLANVYGFYAAYIAELMNEDDLELYETEAQNIEPCLMELAASKIDEAARLAPNMRRFRRRVMQEYEEWISIVKDRAFRAGIPLKAELLDMVYDSPDELGQEAEAESLGFNSSRVHPDIYMNELLCGMRVIHQVLPVMMRKLGIDDDEFKLDTSELRIG